MALSATVNISVSPITLTVVSDKRKVSGTVTAVGETAPFDAKFPITINDSTGRVWTSVSDDGITAVYTG